MELFISRYGGNWQHRINCNHLPEFTVVEGKIVVWNYTVLSDSVWCDIKPNSYSNFCPEDECRIFLRNTCNYVIECRCRNQQNQGLNLHRRGNPRSYILNLHMRQNFPGSLNAPFREEGGTVFLRNIGKVYQIVRFLCSSNHACSYNKYINQQKLLIRYHSQASYSNMFLQWGAIFMESSRQKNTSQRRKTSTHYLALRV